MSIYVLSPRHDMEMAFTSKRAAVHFLEHSAGLNELKLRSLDGPEILPWLMELTERDVKQIAINPRTDGGEERLLSVRDQIDQLTAWLVDSWEHMTLRFPSLVAVTIFRCSQCGSLVEQRTGRLTPRCCGVPMAPAISESACIVGE